MALKIIHIILLASVKYFFTFPYSLLIGLDFKLAMPSIIAGGIAGFLFFYYLSSQITNRFNSVKPFICRMLPDFIKVRYRDFCQRRNISKQKLFTRKSRIIARIRSSYGLWGIIVTTPVLLTIPLGAFLASRYYSRHRYIVLYMVLSIVTWGVVISTLLHVFPTALK